MKIKKIKYQIKKLAKNFNLRYNSQWFDYLWINKKDEILIQYILNCPDPIYNKFGRNPTEKIKNIGKFVDSKEFKNLSKRFGGEVTTRKSLIALEKEIQKIKNDSLKRYLVRLSLKIKRKIKINDNLALLTKTKIKKEYNFIMRVILRHEWIHILLFKNNIDFKKIDKNYWKCNEGLVTYLEGFLDNTLHMLEARQTTAKTSFGKAYYIYGIKFRELFDNKKTPVQRNKVLKDFLKELKTK